MSDDYSSGDRRQPYSDRGEPEGRHAETHDVRREMLTNPVGPQSEDRSFAEQLAPVETRPSGGHAAESTPGVDDKGLHDRLPELSNDELSRLQVLEPGTRLEQGGTYIVSQSPQRRSIQGPGWTRGDETRPLRHQAGYRL